MKIELLFFLTEWQLQFCLNPYSNGMKIELINTTYYGTIQKS